ncbi:MAG: DinB family protein [Bacteroidetes bacterium]|nr:DinB family protein [Bacteroidota bacterium]
MASIQNSFKKLEKRIRSWKDALPGYSDEEFARQPEPGKWSVGQLYAHLTLGTENFHINHIQRCLNGIKAEKGGEKTFPGKISFFFGGFPPKRISVPPSDTYTPKQPDKAQMFAALDRLSASMEKLAEIVIHSDETIKTQHPALGYLNAKEWYLLIVMHFAHHEAQRKRLNKFLGKK